jgi:aspartate racemase
VLRDGMEINMKKLGIVGGIGPASTIEYYKGINEGYQRSLTNPSKSGENPPIVIDSLNLAVAYNLVESKDWESFADLFVNSIEALQLAGAEVVAMAANTAHIVYNEVSKRSPIPVIGLIDETCKYAREKGCKKVIVFGTGFTMSSGMYEEKCAEYDIEAIVPSEAHQQQIHNILFPNLVAGIVLKEDKEAILKIANRMLSDHAADALVLGCTELPLLIKPDDVNGLLLDTTQIHIEAILKYILT